LRTVKRVRGPDHNYLFQGKNVTSIYLLKPFYFILQA
jgi:hypothetical protein